MNYQITERNGIYTAAIPLALKDGRTLWIRGSASVQDTYRDFGINPAIEGYAMVGWNPFKSIGKVVKKITKNKALRKVLKVAKKITTHPATIAALGIVTGGASVAPMTAAALAINLAEKAAKGGKKGDAARAVLKTAVKSAEEKEAKAKKVAALRQQMLEKGLITPEMLSKLQARAMRRAVLRRKKFLSRMPIQKRAASFLVNQHLAA